MREQLGVQPSRLDGKRDSVSYVQRVDVYMWEETTDFRMQEDKIDCDYTLSLYINLYISVSLSEVGPWVKHFFL